MTVCRFYQQGNCRFGDSCRYEHPNAANNRNQTSNRFGALGGGNSSSVTESLLSKYNISADMIEKDLTVEMPQWILSAYAPGRDAPEQLFGGYPREQSFEELRIHFLNGKATGNEQQALNEAQRLYQNAKQQMESAVRNTTEAAKFIVEGENKHPNRNDICKEGTQGAPFGEFLVGKTSNSNSNRFGGSGSTTTNAFGQPSALGQRPNPFGQPSQPTFGQPSQPTSSFSQAPPSSSGFGLPAKPTFGQPSQPTSAFGQPSALGAKPSPFGTPAFGQPSQPAAQSNPFGNTPAQTQGSSFGQPNQLGQKLNPFASTASSGASPFAAVGNNNPPASNPFASTTTTAQTNATPSPFANNNTDQANKPPNPFSQPAQQQSPSPFGQPTPPTGSFPSNPGAASNSSSPFGQPQQQTQPQSSPFGAPTTQPAANPFSQNSSPFGQPQPGPTPNPFASSQPNGTTPQANPFGTPPPQQQVSNAGGATAGASPYPPGSTKQHPPLESYSSKSMDGHLSMFKGKPVTYNKDGLPGIKAFNGTWTRIWFPDGPPVFNNDTALPNGNYDEKTRAQWASFSQTGAFADGLMPELPPPRECTQWDF